MSEHQHQWKLHVHLDGCHFYSSSYLCECGAQRVTQDERDINRDPYAMVWFSEECERCSALAGGAPTISSDTVYETGHAA